MKAPTRPRVAALSNSGGRCPNVGRKRERPRMLMRNLSSTLGVPASASVSDVDIRSRRRSRILSALLPGDWLAAVVLAGRPRPQLAAVRDDNLRQSTRPQTDYHRPRIRYPNTGNALRIQDRGAPRMGTAGNTRVAKTGLGITKLRGYKHRENTHLTLHPHKNKTKYERRRPQKRRGWRVCARS